MKKLDIKEMYKIAKSRKGRCLSKKYVNAMTKLKWQCKEGHIWEARPHGIKRGKWCPYCSGNIKLTIEQMHDIAKSRKGKCLSKVYVNNETHLKWQCEKGH